MSENTKHILVVDDVEEVREGLAGILEAEGYLVDHCSDGYEALRKLEGERIDMVITDILMPNMDGIELVIKARELYPEIKCILISGGGQVGKDGNEYDYLGTGKKLTGVDAVLKKPFKIEELIELVNKQFA